MKNWRVSKVPLDDCEKLEAIQEFSVEAGLPFFVPVKDNLLAQFVIEDDDEICAAGRLEYSYGHPFVEEIAVRGDLRRSGLGTRIVNAVTDEAKQRGIEVIWAMARAPEFFESLGFEPAPETDLLSDLMEDCRVCRDHLTVCNPVLMRKKLVE